MDELYEYLKKKIAEAGDNRIEITIDLSHAFRMYQLVCFMKQIRGICLQEDTMWNIVRKIKESR